MNKADEITLKDYVLTNLNLNGYFTIRLTDNKEYVVYKGKKGKDYILKDGKEVYLNQITFDKKNSTIIVYSDDYDDKINMQELQAINEKCKELGWLDE